MMGVVFNVLEEAITRQWGEQMWDELLTASGLQGAYTSLGTYPDGDLAALADAAADRLGVPREDILLPIGQLMFKDLLARYSGFVGDLTSLRTFLPHLNNAIHPEVLRLYPGASVPRFVLRDMDGDLEMDYLSVRSMCLLAEGLILGAADHFGERVRVHQTSCKLRGDTRCTIRIKDLD